MSARSSGKTGFAVAIVRLHRLSLACFLVWLLDACSGVSPAIAYSPLLDAAASGDAERVKTLIRNGSNVNEAWNDTDVRLESNYSRVRGLTSLMVAAKGGHDAVVQILAEAGADLYAQSRWADGSHAQDAFDYAVEGGHVQVARLLWQLSDKRRLGQQVDTQLATACIRYCDDAFGTDATSNLALFLASISADSPMFGNAIGSVACAGQISRLRFLTTHGVKFPKNTLHCLAALRQKYGPNGMSAQQEAAIARFLLDNGADANDFQKTGASTRTPLMSAAAGQDVDLVKLLLSRGADPNARDERAETAVSLAASTCLRLPSNATEPQIKAVAAQQKAQLSVVEALLQAGARASGGTESGSVANCCGHQPQTETQMSICKLLLQNK